VNFPQSITPKETVHDYGLNYRVLLLRFVWRMAPMAEWGDTAGGRRIYQGRGPGGLWCLIHHGYLRLQLHRPPQFQLWLHGRHISKQGKIHPRFVRFKHSLWFYGKRWSI
jgi:hypothetical protein